MEELSEDNWNIQLWSPLLSECEIKWPGFACQLVEALFEHSNGKMASANG